MGIVLSYGVMVCGVGVVLYDVVEDWVVCIGVEV